jgi:hypothetical protein
LDESNTRAINVGMPSAGMPKEAGCQTKHSVQSRRQDKVWIDSIAVVDGVGGKILFVPKSRGVTAESLTFPRIGEDTTASSTSLEL